MLANFFGKSKPINFIIIFSLFLGFFMLLSFNSGSSFTRVKELFWMLCVFSIYNFILTKNQLSYDNSYAFLFYVILFFFFYDVICLNKFFFTNVMVLLFLRKVYSLQSEKNSIQKLFDGSLWLGIAFLITPETGILLLLLYTSVYLHRQLNFQTLLTPVLGFFTPVILFFTYKLWYNETTTIFKWNTVYNFSLEKHYAIITIVIAVLTLLSFLIKSTKAGVKSTFRNNWILVCLQLILSVIIVLKSNTVSVSKLLLLFFPVSVILANGIELVQKKWLADILIFSSIISALILYFITF